MSEARGGKGFAASDAVLADDPWRSEAATEQCGKGSEERRFSSAFTWLNLVCLDAPLVAISWQALFARALGIPLSWAGSAALFLTAWLIYLGDRFGDSLSVVPATPSSLRQRFCLTYRMRWLAALGVIGAADLLVGMQLHLHQLCVGFVIGACAAVYLIVNRWRPSFWRILPLKEISIGFLFAAGTMVPIAGGLSAAVALPWLLFATLCALNCIFIATWERSLDAAQQRISIATEFPVISRWLIPAVLIVFVASFALAVKSAQFSAVHACVATSVLLLGALHLPRRRISGDARTALADLVLLSPLAAVTFL